MGAGAGAVANMNLTFECAEVLEDCTYWDMGWGKWQVDSAMDGMLYDTQTDWNVGTHSYRDVHGKPMEAYTIIMVPVKISGS